MKGYAVGETVSYQYECAEADFGGVEAECGFYAYERRDF
jgi:hypothetical protein